MVWSRILKPHSHKSRHEVRQQLGAGRMAARWTGDCVLATLSGEYDLTNHDLIASVLADISQRASRLVLDLTDTDYLDAFTMTYLVEVYQQIHQRGGHMTLIFRDDSSPAWMLECLGLHQQLTCTLSGPCGISIADNQTGTSPSTT